jgi:glutamate transport system substrate-binding protein
VRRAFSVCVAAIAALAIVGAGMGAAKAATRPKTISIGIKFDQPGLGLMSPDGRASGFDVDVARYIAGQLGYAPDQIRWVRAPSSEREQLIESGKVSYVVASYSITPERQKLVTFAGPYFVAGQDLLVRENNTDITGPYSLDGKTVCAGAGSDSGAKILQFSPHARVVLAGTYSECVRDLLAGHVDAVTTDDVILAGYATQYPGLLKVVGHPFTKERYGVGLREGDVALQEKITAAIEKMIASGTWQRDVDETIAASGYKSLPPPPVFLAPANVKVAPGTAGASPAVVRVARELITRSDAKDWTGLDALTCPALRGSLNALVNEFTPSYDTNLPTADVTGIGFRNALIGVRQTGPDAALVFADERFTHVPVRYDDYFKDIYYVAILGKQAGDWKMCGLAANFAGG